MGVPLWPGELLVEVSVELRLGRASVSIGVINRRVSHSDVQVTFCNAHIRPEDAGRYRHCFDLGTKRAADP